MNSKIMWEAIFKSDCLLKLVWFFCVNEVGFRDDKIWLYFLLLLLLVMMISYKECWVRSLNSKAKKMKE